MGEIEWFRIDSMVRQGCIASPRLFTIYIYGRSDEGGEDGDGKEGSKFDGDLSGDCLASFMQIAWFYLVTRRKT